MGNKSILGHLHTHHAPVSHDPIAAVTQNISQSIHLERARWVLSLSLSLSFLMVFIVHKQTRSRQFRLSRRFLSISLSFPFPQHNMDQPFRLRRIYIYFGLRCGIGVGSQSLQSLFCSVPVPHTYLVCFFRFCKQPSYNNSNIGRQVYRDER